MEKRKTRVAAYAIIVQDDEMLFCRLSSRVPQAEGKWTLPGGGIEFGEDPQDTVVREVQEETGLTVRIDGLAGVDSMVVGPRHARQHNLRILYFASVTSGTLRNETDGTTDMCKWWNRTDPPELVSVARSGLKLGLCGTTATDG